MRAPSIATPSRVISSVPTQIALATVSGSYSPCSSASASAAGTVTDDGVVQERVWMSSISVWRITAAIMPAASAIEMRGTTLRSAWPSVVCAPATAATSVSATCRRSMARSASGSLAAEAPVTKAARSRITLMTGVRRAAA